MSSCWLAAYAWISDGRIPCVGRMMGSIVHVVFSKTVQLPEPLSIAFNRKINMKINRLTFSDCVVSFITIC